MPDEVERVFVRSFVNFLKSKIQSKTLTADTQESVEVAMQCLQAAFDCEDAENSAETAAAAAGTALNEVDLLELFQSTCVERKADTLELAEKIKNDGNQLMKDGKYNEALVQYNRAIAFDPKNPIFYCNRAAAYIRLGDNERAITDCKSALLYNQQYGKAYGRLGIAYSNLGKYDEAQQAYAKAIELEPENQDYRNNLEVARNARTSNTTTNPAFAPQLVDGLNILLTNPAINNLMNIAGLDLQQLRNMSQNPTVINAVEQMFTALQDSGVPRQTAGTQQIPPELAQIFQTMSQQLANRQAGNNSQQTGNQPPPPQPPPSS